jgi:hypothetical protein
MGLLYDNNYAIARIICMTKKESLKRGRPELEDSEKRSLIIQFRCTSEEKQLMEKAAEHNGKRLSDWLRDQAVKTAKRAV